MTKEGVVGGEGKPGDKTWNGEEARSSINTSMLSDINQLISAAVVKEPCLYCKDKAKSTKHPADKGIRVWGVGGGDV